MTAEQVTIAQVASILRIQEKKAEILVSEARRLYVGKMNERFSDLRISERLKRTNPFLLRIRGIRTVRGWAESQVRAMLFASEEERRWATSWKPLQRSVIPAHVNLNFRTTSILRHLKTRLHLAIR